MILNGGRRSAIPMIVALLGAYLFLFGCSSAKPPRPMPAAVTAADRSASQAAKLSASENWTGAVKQWQNAVDRYRLLNDRTNEAIALHNLGEAQQHAGDFQQAHELLEAAAMINSALKMDGQWWRNQIALLQVEAQSHRTNDLAKRFEEVKGKKPASRNLEALFLNELGLWQTENGDFDDAATTFRNALQGFVAEKNDYGVASVLANEALLLEKQNNFGAAAQKWAEALKLFERLAETKGIAISMAGQGRALLKAEQEVSHAADLLRRAERNFRMLHDEARAREISELLKKLSDRATPSK